MWYGLEMLLFYFAERKALFHTQWEYNMPLHRLEEGRWGDRSLCVFSLRIVHKLSCAQISKSLQIDSQFEYTSTNSIKTVYIDSTTLFVLLHL
jgi:hypothetical protein